MAKISVANDLKLSQIYWIMAMYELTDAKRTIANSRVSVDEAMIAMLTDKLFMIFTLFILLTFFHCCFFSFFYNILLPLYVQQLLVFENRQVIKKS